MAERLFDVASKRRWKGSRALVPVSLDACPACGGVLRRQAVETAPLLRHGGYGAASRIIEFFCTAGGSCRWSLVREVSEVRP